MAINPTFAGFLEEEPRAAFFGTLGQKGLMDSAGRRKQAEDIYSGAMTEFYGKLGEQILGGGEPTMTFSNFIEDYPFTDRFAQLGRQYSQQSMYKPPTRFLYY